MLFRSNDELKEIRDAGGIRLTNDSRRLDNPELKKFKAKSSLKTWLFKITANKCNSIRYKRKIRAKGLLKIKLAAFEVSGLKVVQSWLKYRMKKGAGKKSSSLDKTPTTDQARLMA